MSLTALAFIHFLFCCLPFVLMAFRLSTSARNAACDGMVDLLDVGVATIRVRTGAQPTNVGDADTGTLLGTLTHSATAFGASATGTATAAAITSDTNADASGVAGHFRNYSGGGVASLMVMLPRGRAP